MLDSDVFGVASLLSAGAGVATLVHTRRRLRSGSRREVLEGRVEELESQLVEIESENESLRTKAEFDRQLRSGG